MNFRSRLRTLEAQLAVNYVTLKLTDGGVRRVPDKQIWATLHQAHEQWRAFHRSLPIEQRIFRKVPIEILAAIPLLPTILAAVEHDADSQVVDLIQLMVQWPESGTALVRNAGRTEPTSTLRRLARCEREIAAAIEESGQQHTRTEQLGILRWELDWRAERESILAAVAKSEGENMGRLANRIDKLEIALLPQAESWQTLQWRERLAAARMRMTAA